MTPCLPASEFLYKLFESLCPFFLQGFYDSMEVPSCSVFVRWATIDAMYKADNMYLWKLRGLLAWLWGINSGSSPHLVLKVLVPARQHSTPFIIGYMMSRTVSKMNLICTRRHISKDGRSIKMRYVWDLVAKSWVNSRGCCTPWISFLAD